MNIIGRGHVLHYGGYECHIRGKALFITRCPVELRCGFPGGGIPGNLSYDQFNAAARGFPTMGDGPIGTAVGSSVTVGGADLTPRAGSAAIDAGARPFVPWALKRTVGEWNFRKGVEGLDEHWYMSPAMTGRFDYWKHPRNDLEMPAGVSAVKGGREDWVESCARFKGGDGAVLKGRAPVAAPKAAADAPVCVIHSARLRRKRARSSGVAA